MTNEMSVIVEFTAPSDEFLLGSTLRATPGMVIEIERVVAHGQDQVTPYFWISASDYADFESTVRDDPSVENVERVEEHEDARLYRADWTPVARGIVRDYREVDAVILEAVGQDDRWRLRMRFVAREEVADFLARCSRRHAAVGIRRVYDPDEPHAGGQFGLTPVQRETLEIALDSGYYDRPRRVTHAELAERLGVSQQAVSERLRRAHGNLVRATLTVGGTEAMAKPDAAGPRRPDHNGL